MSKKLQLPNVTLTGITDRDIYGLSLAQEICQKNIEFGSVKLFTSNKTTKYPNLVHINESIDYKGYKKFKVEKLVDYIDTDYILHVEPDGFVLDANLWTDEFFEYDIIGAFFEPLKDHIEYYNFKKSDILDFTMINGGFCLKSKKLLECIKICNNKLKKKKKEYTGDVSDDVWVSLVLRPELEKMGCKFAPIEIINRFSKEIQAHDTFGFHHYKTNIDTWLKNNPEYYMNINRRSIIRKK